MRIAFHAPMKPPSDARPSGDRTVARLLIAALQAAGHRIEVASRFRSWEGGGDTQRQRRLAARGARIAEGLLRRWTSAGSKPPDLWFTYHLYHKAPDWLGPPVTAALGIPYIVAEASSATKRATGPWADGHRAAAHAIAAADLVITLNPADADGIRTLVSGLHRLMPLAPFVDHCSFSDARNTRDPLRRALRIRIGVDVDEPLLLAAAMMRPGDKLASYRVLGEALAAVRDRRWRLVVVGDGPAKADVRTALAAIDDRCCWLGQLDAAALAEAYAACDLLVWPAIGEAWGMALLEAQAAGLPVIAGRSGGVETVVADGETGLLAPAGDAAAFTAAVAALLNDPKRRRLMGQAAVTRTEAVHDVSRASRVLDAALRRIVSTRLSASEQKNDEKSGRNACMAG